MTSGRGHDSLQAVLRLRRIAADRARRDLSACLQTEAAARAALAAVEAGVRRETEAACRLDADDAAVERFARWLRVARQRSAAAQAACAAAEQATVAARGVLAAARAATLAAETLAAHRAAERAAAAARAAQVVLDEAGLQAFRRKQADDG